MKTGIDTLDFLNRRIRFTDCPDCGGPLIRRKAPELYYFCTRCGKIHDVTEAYWVEDIFWQFVWYHNVHFKDREDFSLGKPSPAKEVLTVSKKEMSDATFLVELLCDMDYLEADCAYEVYVYMHDVLVCTKDGYPVGGLRRWRGEDENPEDEAEEDMED